jgi:hypothetical protein
VKEQIMKAITKLAAAGALAFGLGGLAQAADMNGAVAYSLGEFDRVGTSQALPKTESGKVQKPAGTKFAQSMQNREMNAQKAEFVRRMFWMALSMR